MKDEQLAAELLPSLLAMIGQRKVGIRPRRYHPRAIKRRKKPYAMLNKPRAELKKDMVKNWQ